MIIDCIIDRKDGCGYRAMEFYRYLLGCECARDYAENISRAMDYGTNEDVQSAICQYIADNDYDNSLCDYVRSVDWLSDETSQPLLNQHCPIAYVTLIKVTESPTNFYWKVYSSRGLRVFNRLWEAEKYIESINGYITEYDERTR